MCCHSSVPEDGQFWSLRGVGGGGVVHKYTNQMKAALWEISVALHQSEQSIGWTCASARARMNIKKNNSYLLGWEEEFELLK